MEARFKNLAGYYRLVNSEQLLNNDLREFSLKFIYYEPYYNRDNLYPLSKTEVKSLIVKSSD